MNRFHVHLDDLETRITFKAALFGATRTRTDSEYSKWTCDDTDSSRALRLSHRE